MFANQEIPGYSFGRSDVAGNPYVSAVWTIHKHRNHIKLIMKTNRDSKPHQPQAATTPSLTKIGGLDVTGSSPELQQIIDQLMPELRLDDPDAKADEHDVTFKWNVKVVLGKDTAFLHFRGSSVLNRMLAPESLATAPYKAEEEIVSKIVMPVVAAIQAEANRRALEIVAAEQNEDLAPLT